MRLTRDEEQAYWDLIEGRPEGDTVREVALARLEDAGLIERQPFVSKNGHSRYGRWCRIRDKHANTPTAGWGTIWDGKQSLHALIPGNILDRTTVIHE